VRAAAGTFDLEIPEAGVQRVANRRGRLCGAAVALHAVIPGVAGRDIGNEPRLPGAAIEQSFAMMKSFTGSVAVSRPPSTIDSLLVRPEAQLPRLPD